jgi:Tfp pilus assembly protein PilN
MPIRLNLLAEAQAAEDLRRRDPVKRALWIAGLLVALMVVWVGSLQLQAIVAKQQFNRVAAQMAARTNDYRKVVETQKKIGDVNHRLLSLHTLTTNRFLNATLLNALQKAVVDEIQLTQLRVQQDYKLVEEIKARTNGSRITPGKPAKSTEKIVVTLEGIDSSPSPGDEVARYKEVLAQQPYFQAVLGKTNEFKLKSLSAPQISPESGRAIVLFSLECQFPEITR